MKQFMLYGMIRKSGTTSGHYVYDRQDLTSNKHILYNDTAVTLFDDEIQMNSAGGLNAYLLVYMEVESSPIEASASAPAEAPASAPVKAIASAPTSASVSAPVSTSASAPVKASANSSASTSASAPKNSVTTSSVKSQQPSLQQKELERRQRFQQRRSEEEAEQQRAKQLQRELASAPRSTAMIMAEAPSAPTHEIIIKKPSGGSITDTNEDTPHRRTLRASKQSPKKRTLRAAKKLRQLLNST